MNTNDDLRFDAARVLTAVLLTCAVLGLGLRIVGLLNPVGFGDDGVDELTYAVIARRMLAGYLPYTQAFDHKPIGLYYIYSLFLSLFGGGYAAVRLITFASIAASVWALYAIASRRWPSRHRWTHLAVIAFMTTCASFGNGGHASNTEIIQMPFFAAWWLVALNLEPADWRRPLLLGGLAGVAAQINYLGGFVLSVSTAMMLGWPLLSSVSLAELKRFVVAGLLALAAFGVVVLATLWPLIREGLLAQYFGLQGAAIAGYAGSLNGAKVFRAAVSMGASVGFGLALLIATRLANGRWPVVAPRDSALWRQLVLVMLFTLVPIVMTQRLYPHYFNLLIVPATLLFLMLLSGADRKALRLAAVPAVLLAAMLVGRGAWDVYLKNWNDGFRNQASTLRLAALLHEHVGPADRALLINLDHSLYFLADVAPSTQFFFKGQILADRMLANMNSSPEQEIEKALATGPAAVMACLDGDVAAIEPMLVRRLAGRYEEIAVADTPQCGRIRYFVRPPASAPGQGR